jgi:diguanylate cyclase (GGDEF)-like protein
MSNFRNPVRTTLFRVLTIASATICTFALTLWLVGHGIANGLAGLPDGFISVVIAALCSLAAAGAAASFFAGVNESIDFVRRETQVDKLTGFHARNAMIGKIAAASERALATGEPVFLIDIDIDRFKQINDSIGYQSGDELIRGFARRLREALPREMEIGRIGAGEFAVIYPDRPDLPAVDALIEPLMEKLGQAYRLSTHLQSVSISAGIVAIPRDGRDPIAILRRSNLALQHARASGISNWAAFTPEISRVAEFRQWVEAELHVAFQRGDFSLHYQPQMDLAKGRVVGYEALLRWRHPERGMISPLDFIPVAEETGMIGPIGAWVLKKACIDARVLPDDCFVAVNISPVQFTNKDFVTLVRQTMDETGIRPDRLELELTESAMMQDRERAAEVLSELAGLGISVAVDDFGTGYSNLSYLIDFQFRKLKIDRSFITRMEQDESGGAVVSTIVGLSRALGVRPIAEGVETESQATLLRAAGCDVVQGYLYGRPEPLMLDEAEKLERRIAVH